MRSILGHGTRVGGVASRGPGAMATKIFSSHSPQHGSCFFQCRSWDYLIFDIFTTCPHGRISLGRREEGRGGARGFD